MSVSAVVESLEDVPEELHDYYEETDGGYKLQLEGAETEDEIAGLKSALEKERKERRTAKRRLKQLESTYEEVDPERYQELLDAAEERERAEAEKKGEWESLRQQLQEQHQKEIAQRDQRLETLQSALHEQMIDAAATRAIAAEQGEPSLLLPHVKSRVRVVEEDGRFAVRVLNGDGEPQINNEGEYMTIAELVRGMKADKVYGRAFDASGATGSGATGGRGGAAGKKAVKTRADFGGMQDKVAFIREHGLEAFEALPSE